MKQPMLKKLTFTVTLLAATALAQTATPTQPTPVPKVKVPYTIITSLPGYTYLKLDTRTGQIWQVQYAVQNPSSGLASLSYSQTAINPTPLADGTVLGRFSLNLDTTSNSQGALVLLDQIGGGVWLLVPPGLLVPHLGPQLYTFIQIASPS